MISSQEENLYITKSMQTSLFLLTLWGSPTYLSSEKQSQEILSHWSINEASSVVEIKDKCFQIRLVLQEMGNMRRKYIVLW